MALDTRLDRDVAMTLLPEAFAHDADRDAGFFAAGKGPGVQAMIPTATASSPNLLCSLGYGDPSKLFPRNPRLGFAEACPLL